MNFHQLVWSVPHSECTPVKNITKNTEVSSINTSEMKKFWGLIILMREVRKDNMKDYWSTDSMIYTSNFLFLISWVKTIEAIWEAWHFGDNSQHTQDEDRLQNATWLSTEDVIKKPRCLLQFSKYMKGDDRFSPCLSYYSTLGEEKCSKNAVMYVLNSALLNEFFVYKT
jgi:hypothetical protein